MRLRKQRLHPNLNRPSNCIRGTRQEGRSKQNPSITCIDPVFVAVHIKTVHLVVVIVVAALLFGLHDESMLFENLLQALLLLDRRSTGKDALHALRS